jgi:diaminopimelate decarboxylase
VEHAAAICDNAEFRPRFVDCGGGLPIGAEAEPALEGLRAAIRFAQTRFSPQLEEVWLENGRFLTTHSSVLAVRVVDSKERPECRYLICDGGRTNHALAADNGPHRILTLPERNGTMRLTTICGPTCMTDDVLARVPLPQDVMPGDVIVWMAAGAYHLPWETRFSHGLSAVAWCDEGDEPTLARERERPEEWIRPWNL